MNKIIARLRSKTGESLIESMAAILIFTFASIVMYTMIMSANDINRQAAQKEQEVENQMRIVEMMEGAGTTSAVNFVINGDTSNPISVTAETYGETGGMYAYYPEGVSHEEAE